MGIPKMRAGLSELRSGVEAEGSIIQCRLLEEQMLKSEKEEKEEGEERE